MMTRSPASSTRALALCVVVLLTSAAFAGQGWTPPEAAGAPVLGSAAGGPRQSSRMVAIAIQYARLGWPVFPVWGCNNGRCECGGGDGCSPGKHPRTPNGLLDASLDLATIARWWRRWPGSNIGVAVGAAGIVVLDVDPRHGGGESLWELQQLVGREAMETVRANTGGGGLQFFFLADRNVALGNSAGRLGPGLDIRALGGYVVVYPSMHISGRRYEWATGRNPWDWDFLPLPDLILERLQRHVSRSAAPHGLSQPIVEGGRNDVLASLAGSLHRRRIPPDVVESALVFINEHHCVPPLPDGEVRRTARSITSRAPDAGTQADGNANVSAAIDRLLADGRGGSS